MWLYEDLAGKRASLGSGGCQLRVDGQPLGECSVAALGGSQTVTARPVLSRYSFPPATRGSRDVCLRRAASDKLGYRKVGNPHTPGHVWMQAGGFQ
jgi:hypothetical protein